MRKLIVNEKYNNKKLTNYIFDTFPNLNKNVLYKALRKKDIKINNVRISTDVQVHTNDEILLYIIDDFLFGISNLNIEIVYEDENILIANKPSNLEVVSALDNNNNNTFSLTSYLKNKYDKNIEPCHRIDRNTKGLVLFAKNSTSLKILLEKFKNGEIEKHYLAKVYGIPNEEHKILEAYLFKDSKKNIVYIKDDKQKNYQKIITEYTILKKDKKKNISLLDINLHTGKTHQIRAHLAHLGFPIIGDGKYGINEINKKFGEKVQCLYSYSLTFNFKTDSSILNYLNKKTIKLNNLADI